MDRQKFLQQLKDEIQKDPQSLGYIGKTPQQVADLINTPIVVKKDIIQPPEEVIAKPGDKIGERTEIQDPRVFQVIGGIVGAPNGVTEQDIIDALQ